MVSKKLEKVSNATSINLDLSGTSSQSPVGDAIENVADNIDLPKGGLVQFHVFLVNECFCLLLPCKKILVADGIHFHQARQAGMLGIAWAVHAYQKSRKIHQIGFMDF